MKNTILSKIPTECPWRDTLYWYPCLDSTNDLAKQLAKDGAAQGTVVIAGQQSAGRGRMGRTFQSPDGGGVYLSVILRPDCPATELMHLTCAAGVAMVKAIQRTAGIRPGIKWINDLVWEGKKLGGILTELSLDTKTGLVEYAVIGIGINCRKSKEAFTPEVEQIALSLSEAAECDVAPEALAAQMVYALWEMDLKNKAAIMDAYKSLCVTLGKPVMVLRNGEKYPGQAVDMDDDGGLLVRFDDGQTRVVSSGEVSVRGLWDYV